MTSPTLFGAPVTETVTSKKLSSAQRIQAGIPAGVYDYQIFMLKSGKKAKGNSDPVIIIDS